MASIIVSLFPQFDHYIEVMCGAAHVFFKKAPSELETLNDINGGLTNFWIVCRDHNEALREKLKWTPYSRSLFEEWRHTPRPSEAVERAARWFYCNAAQYSSAFHGGWSYLKTPESCGTPPAERFRRRTDRLEAVRDRLANVQIECADYREVIQRFGGNENSLMYIDPPYVGYERHYIDTFTDADHGALADLLQKVECKVILSYADHPMIRGLYRKWKIRRFEVVRPSAKVKTGEKKPKAKELLIMNYDIEPDLFNLDAVEVVDES